MREVCEFFRRSTLQLVRFTWIEKWKIDHNCISPKVLIMQLMKHRIKYKILARGSSTTKVIYHIVSVRVKRERLQCLWLTVKTFRCRTHRLIPSFTTIFLRADQSKLLKHYLSAMTIKKVQHFIVVAITAILSVSLTYTIVARSSVNEPLCTKFAQNLPKPQEPEVCLIKHVFIKIS